MWSRSNAYARHWLTVVPVAAALVLGGCAPHPVAAPKAEAPATVEGGRVILTAKAAERLGIQSVALRTDQVVHTRRIAGEVVVVPPASDAPAEPKPVGQLTAAAAAPSGVPAVLVRVPLLPGEMKQVDRSQATQILPFARSSGVSAAPGAPRADDVVTARALAAPPVPVNPKDAGALYYALDSPPPGYAAGQRVFVDVPLSTSVERKIIPYTAVIYGLQGETWTYTRPEPLVFVRAPIAVDYIDGDLAVLTDGPASGTAVVTVGGSELFGVETGVAK
jgi:hypothetical protein